MVMNQHLPTVVMFHIPRTAVNANCLAFFLVCVSHPVSQSGRSKGRTTANSLWRRCSAESCCHLNLWVRYSRVSHSITRDLRGH